MDDTQQPLLKDVIDIKETVSTSDFVLKLAEAVTRDGAEDALRQYVVTEQLVENFDEALSLIRSALDGDISRAAYLHGSYGSGKSHFMAVLYALLSSDQAALARPEFDRLLAKHEWLTTEGRNFLLVPYHMMGAKAMEQRVLGGYVEHVLKLHPEAPIPQVYRTDALFDDIRNLRERMGEAAVITSLNSAQQDQQQATEPDPDGWGEEAAAFSWTSELLDTALAAPEAHEAKDLNVQYPSTPADLRARLVDDARKNLLPGFTRGATEDEHGFISLDAGLSVIAEHARSLGYDGLVLFLDELILWLATLIQDQKFVAREAGKITNFVEGADARRAIPVVSFIARQRDLRELVGEELSGAAEGAIQDTLNQASGRFDKITLEDRNLPQITRNRLLRPKEGKTELIDAAFERTKRSGGPKVWDALLGSEKATTGADEEAFRLTYPFSPVFMDVLVHLSNALQRSRTGLKLMGQILVDNRDSMRLGQLVPVGDLYPLLAEGGDQPFVDSMKVEFATADKLYRNRVRPYLLEDAGVTEDDVARYTKRPDDITDQELRGRCAMFVGNNRLVQTLLLSALAPSVPAFTDLTLRRLEALNRGSVTAPIPGTEPGIIKGRIAEWASRFPEIKETGTETNPGVRLELSGVDVDSVVQNASVNDNAGNRMALAKRLLAEELEVERQDGRMGADELKLVWRGSNRTCEVLFGNVANADDVPDHELQPQMDGAWRIIVDVPFDEGNYMPRDDVLRMDRLREAQGEGHRSRTVAWIPTHLSMQRMRDFRRLVVIDKLLADDNRFATRYAAHLNQDSRERAKGLLESQRGSLLRQVRAAFKQAYGLTSKQEADVLPDFDEHFRALPDVPDLKVSIGQSMNGAIRDIAGKLLAHQYPDHPDLDPDGTGTAVKVADARTVFGHIQQSAQRGTRDRRVEVPAKDRKAMQRIAEPLGLGRQKEVYFELSMRWAEHFRHRASTEGATGDLGLNQLVEWIDQPAPRGLEPFLAYLVVAAYAEMDDRVWVRGGMPTDPAPDFARIKPTEPLALRTQPLPEENDWQEARDRLARIFGETSSELRRGQVVNHVARQITQAARKHLEDAAELVRQLEAHSTFLRLDTSDDGGRLALAQRSLDLLHQLASGGASESLNSAKKTVETLARFDLGRINPERYGTSITQARKVAQALAGASWDTLELAEGQGVEGQALLESLRGKARADQRTADLGEALTDTRAQVTALVKRNQPAQPAPVPPPPPAAGPEDVELSGGSSDPTIPGAETTGNEQGPGDRLPDQPARPPRDEGSTRTTAARAAQSLQDELAELAARHPDATVVVTWRVEES